jgi:hypothetical protein
MNKMEYYSAIKKNEIMLFADKWLEVEIVSLIKVRQILKDNGFMNCPYVNAIPRR